MAESEPTTNVVPIRKAPPPPAPLRQSPELAVLLAILDALPKKQRARVKGALFRKAFEDTADANLYRAYHHIGRAL